MAVIMPPGQGGLSDEIANLKKQVAELSRRKESWKPVVTIRVAAGGVTMANNVDVFAQTGWSVFSGNNTITWTVPGVGTASYATLPIAGRYYIQFHNSWAANGVGVRACKILKNGTTIVPAGSTNVIGSADAAGIGGGEGNVLDAVCTSEVFAAGDKIYFSTYQNSGGNLLMKDVDISGWTSMTILYLGPA